MRIFVWDLLLKDLTHLKLSSVQDDEHGSVCILYMQLSRLANILFQRCYYFPVCIYGFLIKKQVSIGMWNYVWVFNQIPSITKSVSMQQHAGFISVSLQHNLRSGMVILAVSSFATQDCFSSSGYIMFHLQLNTVSQTEIQIYL